MSFTYRNHTQPTRRPSPRGPQRYFTRQRPGDPPTLFEELMRGVYERHARRLAGAEAEEAEAAREAAPE